jgi:hypothetical protein
MISHLREHHLHQEILYLRRQIYKQPPPDLDRHLVVDNYITLKRDKVNAWLARHPLFQVHFSPKY